MQIRDGKPKSEWNFCPHCGHKLDISWECTLCEADFYRREWPWWGGRREHVRLFWAQTHPMNAAIQFFNSPVVGTGSIVSEKSDLRTMNAMDPETKAVHLRLEAWGAWARDSGIRAWPQTTVLGRVIEEGPHGALSTGRPPTDMSDEVAHVDAAVAHLGEVDRRVIRKYYLEWAPPEAMAATLRMRLASFRAVLKRARWRIGGFLAAIE